MFGNSGILMKRKMKLFTRETGDTGRKPSLSRYQMERRKQRTLRKKTLMLLNTQLMMI